ncbi:substrate-binding periplasmic protein [Candidatus Terasakiella magnetica]|uniref:substrate-binding periplasmic protein n=1 Tax=Candidatus Terasakiella magnetica TaxID=1867952 RepID=UPI0013F4D43B|nr:transporter substrate-binding domain-containing protein [Candidatus Terasakiella magnetica]
MLKLFKIVCLSFALLIGFYQKSQARDLRICTHIGFEPYVIKDGTSLKGIDIDIVLAILKKMKQSAEINAYPWKRLLASIKSGQCDVGFSLFDTEQRREYADYIFTVPLHYSTFSVFVRNDKAFNFNRITDFFGKKIAHNRGFALSVGFEQAIADKKLERITFDNASNAVLMLERGRIDAIIDNEARFRYYLKKHNKLKHIKSLTIPFMPHHPAFLVVSRNSDMDDIEAIKQRLETELKNLHLDGTIMRITTQYLN